MRVPCLLLCAANDVQKVLLLFVFLMILSYGFVHGQEAFVYNGVIRFVSALRLVPFSRRGISFASALFTVRHLHFIIIIVVIWWVMYYLSFVY